MQVFKVSDKLIQRFWKTVVDCEVLLPSEEVTAQLGLPWLKPSGGGFFDLDKLWHQPQCFAEVTSVLSDVVKEIDEQAHFDTIVPIVSAVASFGPTPIAAVLARELQKELVVFDEVDFGEMAAYPLTLSHNVLLKQRRILLIKDVLVHGASVQRAAQLIHTNGGQVVALLVFLDRKPPQRRYDFRDLPRALYAVLLEPARAQADDQG